MPVHKIIATTFIVLGFSANIACAQSAVGKTTRLMHPSGIPASVATDNGGTTSNVDGRIVSSTKNTDLSTHEEAVKELRWSGFRLQKTGQ